MGRRFLVNLNPMHKEIHDLRNQKPECQISEIVDYQFLSFDDERSLEVWLMANPSYDGCAHCLPQYHRK